MAEAHHGGFGCCCVTDESVFYVTTSSAEGTYDTYHAKDFIARGIYQAPGMTICVDDDNNLISMSLGA